MASADNMLKLSVVFHPEVRFPFDFDSKKMKPVEVNGEFPIIRLMEAIEARVEDAAKESKEEAQMQIQVLWKKGRAKTALSPSSRIKDSLKDGDSVVVYGEVLSGPAPGPRIPEDQKLPVTILTGFLGAGKTTLLNYILQEQTEKKIAVIENEFGEVSIDDALLKKDKMALAEKVVVMDNGCMCCTVRGDLQAGLEEILKEMDSKKTTIDQIMIETTGMADPVPIVRTFMTNPALTSRLRLDGVVTVADAKHIVARLDDEVEEGKVNEAYQQIAFCDKLLLNKLDLVTPEAAIAVKERLRSINAFAKILPSVKGRVKISEITNMLAHDMTSFAERDIEREAEDVPIGHGDGHGDGGHGGHSAHGHEQGHGHGHGHGHGDGECTEEHGSGGGHGGGHGHAGGCGHGHGHEPAAKRSRHDSRVNSMALVREGEVLPKKLGEWMQSLAKLPEERGVIFRIKGILAIRGHPFKHVFHAVMDVSDEDDAEMWGPDEKRVTKIVFIGKGMDKQFLRESFEAIFA